MSSWLLFARKRNLTSLISEEQNCLVWSAERFWGFIVPVRKLGSSVVPLDPVAGDRASSGDDRAGGVHTLFKVGQLQEPV